MIKRKKVRGLVLVRQCKTQIEASLNTPIEKSKRKNRKIKIIGNFRSRTIFSYAFL